MADYREMYLTLFRATEDAMGRLVEAQRKCEELYMSSPEVNISVLELPRQEEENP